MRLPLDRGASGDRDHGCQEGEALRASSTSHDLSPLLVLLTGGYS
jgi:hypothetical protein